MGSLASFSGSGRIGRREGRKGTATRPVDVLGSCCPSGITSSWSLSAFQMLPTYCMTEVTSGFISYLRYEKTRRFFDGRVACHSPSPTNEFPRAWPLCVYCSLSGSQFFASGNPKALRISFSCLHSRRQGSSTGETERASFRSLLSFLPSLPPTASPLSLPRCLSR